MSMELSNADIRRVELPPGTCYDTDTDLQVSYLNHRKGQLIPNTEVWVGNELLVKINSLGCKGEELNPELGTIGFFGDSTMFGVAGATLQDGWPFHVNVHGYQTLNAAVEVHAFDLVCARYDELKARVSMAAVVVGGSWHNLVCNEKGDQAWRRFLQRFSDARVLALCTIPTAFSPDSSKHGIDDVVGNRFRPWADWPTNASKSREAYDAVLRYNALVRRYCRETGTALIDLFYVYRPESRKDMPYRFIDPAHARAELYPAFGQCATNVLERLL
jgi:hypothetical protein